MNEEQVVQHLARLIVNDGVVQTHINELCPELPEQEGHFTEAQLELMDARDELGHSERANCLYRLLGLVAASLYNPKGHW